MERPADKSNSGQFQACIEALIHDLMYDDCDPVQTQFVFNLIMRQHPNSPIIPYIPKFTIPPAKYNEAVYNILPNMANLTQLNLSYNACILEKPFSGVDGHHHLNKLGQLLSLPSLSSLSSLTIRQCQVAITGATTIASVSATLPLLTRLDLGSNELGPSEGVKALVMTSTFPRLAILTLDGNGIDSEGALAIASSPNLTMVTELQLQTNNITTLGAKAISASRFLTKVTTLNLYSNGIDSEGVQAITTSHSLSGLQCLNLGKNLFGFGGLEAIASATNFTHLVELHMGETLADVVVNGDEGSKIAAIAASTALPNLTTISLDRNKLGPQDVQCLASSPFLAGKLIFANLNYNQIGNEGVKHLITSTTMTNLESLLISSNQIGDEAARLIATSPSLAKLQVLDLSSNNISPDAIKTLTTSAILTNMISLNVRYNQSNSMAKVARIALFRSR